MKFNNILFFLVFVMFQAHSQSPLPADMKATKETARLFRNLDRIAKSGKYLFGHQDDLAYGVNWKYEKGRSDIKDVTGDYPALYGWELGGIESNQKKNLDGVPFDLMRGFIQQAYAKGGVISISWHGINPLTGKTAWDPAPNTVASILRGGEKHALFKAQLDKVATFLKSLKGAKGEYIPVLFRPYHELSGDWFWWGTKYTTAAEYKDFFRFTVDYLKNQKGIHHLLYIYNSAGTFTNATEFLEHYPGDEYIDVLSFDEYQFDDPQTSNRFIEEVNSRLKIAGEIAQEKNKIFALAETGYEAIPYKYWWTKTLSKAIGDNKIAYALVWRNHGYHTGMKKMHYYAPYRGQISTADFIKYYKQPETLFQKDINTSKIYQ